MKGDKTMNITVTGTVDEIIAFAELLKAGKKAQEPSKPIDVVCSHLQKVRDQKAQEPEKPIESQDWELQYWEPQDWSYVAIAVDEDIFSAINQCSNDHATGELSFLKGAKDHVEALLARAIASGRVVCVDNINYLKYNWVGEVDVSPTFFLDNINYLKYNWV